MKENQNDINKYENNTILNEQRNNQNKSKNEIQSKLAELKVIRDKSLIGKDSNILDESSIRNANSESSFNTKIGLKTLDEQEVAISNRQIPDSPKYDHNYSTQSNSEDLLSRNTSLGVGRTKNKLINEDDYQSNQDQVFQQIKGQIDSASKANYVSFSKDYPQKDNHSNSVQNSFEDEKNKNQLINENMKLKQSIDNIMIRYNELKVLNFNLEKNIEDYKSKEIKQVSQIEILTIKKSQLKVKCEELENQIVKSKLILTKEGNINQYNNNPKYDISIQTEDIFKINIESDKFNNLIKNQSSQIYNISTKNVVKSKEQIDSKEKNQRLIQNYKNNFNSSERERSEGEIIRKISIKESDKEERKKKNNDSFSPKKITHQSKFVTSKPRNLNINKSSGYISLNTIHSKNSIIDKIESQSIETLTKTANFNFDEIINSEKKKDTYEKIHSDKFKYDSRPSYTNKAMSFSNHIDAQKENRNIKKIETIHSNRKFLNNQIEKANQFKM